MRKELLGAQTVAGDHRDVLIDLITPTAAVAIARFLLKRMPAGTVAAVVLAATKTTARTAQRGRLRVAASELLHAERSSMKVKWQVEDHGFSVYLDAVGFTHIVGRGTTHAEALNDLYTRIEERYFRITTALCSLDPSLQGTFTPSRG